MIIIITDRKIAEKSVNNSEKGIYLFIYTPLKWIIQMLVKSWAKTLPMAKIQLVMICIGLTELLKTVSHLCMFIYRRQQFSFLFLLLYFFSGGGWNVCWDIMKKYLVLCSAKKIVQTFNMRAIGKISLLLLTVLLSWSKVITYLFTQSSVTY